jgi:hypothetical protein
MGKITKIPPIRRFLGFAKTVALTIWGGLQKVPTTKITITTTTKPNNNNYNNNNDADNGENDNNNDNNDNNDKDDNKDASRSMSCPQIQIKSPFLFPSPDRHRRYAKLYNLNL